MCWRLLATGIVSVGLVSGCATGPRVGDEAQDIAVSSTVPPEQRDPTVDFAVISNLTYLTVGDVEFLMDVYTPANASPRSTVVAFHGRSSATKDSADVVAVAEAAARRGMAVFVPAWLIADTISIDSIDTMVSAGNCAVAFAQQHGREYGANPARLAVYGFSAGTGPAQRVALDPTSTPIPGCSAAEPPEPIQGAVLGDGEYFWHSENFDPVFRDHPVEMRQMVTTMTDPAAWPPDLTTRFHLWAAADGTAPRPLTEPGSDDDWLAMRDPDGSIRRDLHELGLLDDRVVDYIDSARLFEHRLASAGVDVTMRVSPGCHSDVDRSAEIVEALSATLE